MRAALPAAALLLAVVAARADDGRADARAEGSTPPDAVIAVVGSPGASRAVTAGALHDRIAAMPGFERTTFGATPDALRHGVLERVFVRDALLSLSAQASGLEKDPQVALAVDCALANATARGVAASLPPASDLPAADVRAYYDAHPERYAAPARIRLWRILCESRQDADAVLAAAQAEPTPKAFAQLARDHSADKATALRSGDLGFLTPAGESSEPDLKVDPALVTAAAAVRDGEFVRAPVPEGPDGKSFAVIRRRGSTPAIKRSLEDATPEIRAVLRRQRAREATDKLVADLRAARLRDLHADPLDTLDLPDAPSLHSNDEAGARGDKE